MYTCLIVDDRQDAIDLIADHVNKTPQLEIKYAGMNPIEALSFLDNEWVDILFLDIEMPEITGLDFVEAIKNRWGNNIPKVVFATGYSKYAVQGFEYGAVDYIMKPVSYKRFKKCVDRIFNDLDKRSSSDPSDNFFFTDVDGKKIRIDYDSILYMEGARNYTIVVTNEKKLIIYKTLSAIIKLLPEKKFIRIHKSYIIAINKIQAIMANQLVLHVKNEEVLIPIGVTYKNKIQKRLKIT